MIATKGRITGRAEEDEDQIVLAQVFEPRNNFKFYHATVNSKAKFRCPQGWSGPEKTYMEYLFLGPNEEYLIDPDSYTLVSDKTSEYQEWVGDKIGPGIPYSDENFDYLKFKKKRLEVTVKKRLGYKITSMDLDDSITSDPFAGEVMIEGPVEFGESEDLICKRPKTKPSSTEGINP